MDLLDIHHHCICSNSFELNAVMLHFVLLAHVRKLLTLSDRDRFQCYGSWNQYNPSLYLLVSKQRLLSLIGLRMGHHDLHDELPKEQEH